MVEQEQTLLREMLERLERMERRQKARQRRGLIAAGVVLLALVLAAAALTPRVSAAVTSYEETMEQVSRVSAVVESVDMESLTAAVETLSGEDMAALARSLSELDMAELQEHFADIQTALDKLSQVDVEALNETMEKVNDTLAPIANFFNRSRE